MSRNNENPVTIPLLYECADGEALGFACDISDIRVRRLSADNKAAWVNLWKSLAEADQQRIIAAVKLGQRFDRAASPEVLTTPEEELRGRLREIDDLAGIDPLAAMKRIHREMGQFKFFSDVKLVVWNPRPGRGLRIALLAPDLPSALLVHAFFRFAGGRGVAICPKCGVPVFQRRRDQVYCCPRHREAGRVERWRAAQRRKSKRTKGGRRSKR